MTFSEMLKMKGMWFNTMLWTSACAVVLIVIGALSTYIKVSLCILPFSGAALLLAASFFSYTRLSYWDKLVQTDVSRWMSHLSDTNVIGK